MRASKSTRIGHTVCRQLVYFHPLVTILQTDLPTVLSTFVGERLAAPCANMCSCRSPVLLARVWDRWDDVGLEFGGQGAWGPHKRTTGY